jgi:hypothetical protein
LAHSYHDEQTAAQIDPIVRVQSAINVIDGVADEEAGSQ